MPKLRLPQVLLALGWLLITGLTIYATLQGFQTLVPMFLAPWTLPPWTLLVLVDFMVELILISVFIYWDSRRRGKNPWAWIVVSMTLGAVGTCGYLFMRGLDRDAVPIFGRPSTGR